MDRVAGYVRVSTEQQRDEGSHDRQRERLEEWSDRQDVELDLYQDIAISGQADVREEYEEMMDQAETYDAVVVRELSRFGRSLRTVLEDIERLDELDTDFVSLNDNFDTSTAQGKLLMQIIGAFNEFWANLARERAREEVERRREQGEPIGRPTKLNDKQIEQVRDWRENGISYGNIATLCKAEWGVDVSRRTIYRYVKQAEA
jgi:DNA invertase Pin-like site-specific DNA recombinase